MATSTFMLLRAGVRVVRLLVTGGFLTNSGSISGAAQSVRAVFLC